eukprot:Selendium_serpulae@DN4389_c0_g1_i1.p1
MQFVKAAVLESKNGNLAEERQTKAVDAKGFDYFSDKDRFVSQTTAALKTLYAVEGNDRQESLDRRQWVSQAAVPDLDLEEDGNQYGLSTRTQEEHEFLARHHRMQQRHQQRDQQEMESFRQLKLKNTGKAEEDSITELVEAQRKIAARKSERSQLAQPAVAVKIVPRKRKSVPTSSSTVEASSSSSTEPNASLSPLDSANKNKTNTSRSESTGTQRHNVAGKGETEGAATAGPGDCGAVKDDGTSRGCGGKRLDTNDSRTCSAGDAVEAADGARPAKIAKPASLTKPLISFSEEESDEDEKNGVEVDCQKRESR